MDRISDLLEQRRATKAAIIKRLEQGPMSVSELSRDIDEDDFLVLVLACDDLLERGKIRLHRGRRRSADRDPRELMGELNLKSFHDDPHYGIRRLAEDGLDRDGLIEALDAIWGPVIMEKCVRSKSDKRRDEREGRFMGARGAQQPIRRF